MRSRNSPHSKASAATGHAHGIYQLFSHHPKVAGTIEPWSHPFENSRENNPLPSRDKVLHEVVHALNQRCCFLKAGLHGSRSQGVGRGVAPFAITWGDSLAKFAPSVCGLCSAGQEILMPKGKMFLPGGRTMVALSWKFRLLLAILELSYL